MRKKSLFVSFLMGLVFAIFFSGCQGQKSDVIKIAMLPKFKGENYFDACKNGAEEAIAELNKNATVVQLIYDGPTQDQANNQKQVDILEGWIAQKVNAIILSPNDPIAISPTLKKAQSKGIKIITFDADAKEDSRDLFINQVVASGVAYGVMESVGSELIKKGYGPNKNASIAFISSAKTDANQQSWVAEIKKLLATDYTWIVLENEEKDIYYPGPDETKTQNDAATLISRMGADKGQIQAAVGLSSMAAPALASQYQAAANKPDPKTITLVGIGTPNALKSYIKDETNPMDNGVLWNSMDLGYMSVMGAYQMITGEIDASSTNFIVGRLGSKEINDKVAVLGPALIFNVANVDKFNY